jgi:hypothetical protein
MTVIKILTNGILFCRNVIQPLWVQWKAASHIKRLKRRIKALQGASDFGLHSAVRKIAFRKIACCLFHILLKK